MHCTMNGNYIEPNDKGELQSVYTVEKDACFQRSPSFDPSHRVTLSWHNINVYVKPKRRRFWYPGQKYDINEQKQLLRDVNGEVKPGQLMAIMGASGAGKTTLLNVLTNRNLRLLNVEGSVLVNGQSVGESIIRLSAYVQQDDLFIGTLTVKEHLIFSACLRMDKHLNYEERMKRVNEVMAELNLVKCADTVIGAPGMVKGISGGEAKRLAFAAELLTKPALMFCDEPTSGLDSFISRSLVSVLRDLARGGRTIICTIHQPSSDVFELFDHLLLMAEGRVAYRGKASLALDFFSRVGLRCPINYNPADFYVQNLAIACGRENESREKVLAIVSQFAKEDLEMETSPTDSHRFSIPMPHVRETTRYKVPWVSQFRTVFWRSCLSLRRDVVLLKVRLFQAAAMGLLIGLIFLQQDMDQKGVMNINGAIFLLLVNVSFNNMYTVINAFTVEEPVFRREHWNGMYRVDVYFLSKTISEAPILMLMTTILICIVYWMTGFRPDLMAFLICLVIFNLAAHTAASFGYMISCISTGLNVAPSIASPFILPFVIFGGFYLNIESVPKYFIWLKYLSMFYYGNEALLINQWVPIQNITCTSSHCMRDGKAVLASLDFNEDNLFPNIIAITVLMIVFRILAFIGLLVKSSRRT